MNRRQFFKTAVGAGVIAATPKPVLALLAPVEPLPLIIEGHFGAYQPDGGVYPVGVARLSTPVIPSPCKPLTLKMVRRVKAHYERIYG